MKYVSTVVTMGDWVWNWRMLRAGGAQLGPHCWSIKNLGTK